LTDFVFVRIHAMPCVNKCWHCFCEGSPQGRFMDTEKCILVLDQLSDLKSELGTIVFPMYFDEPTLHPSFKQIMEYQLEKNLKMRINLISGLESLIHLRLSRKVFQVFSVL